MAIVSISRIQIRRGRKGQGSGLPQLAGGELGWAVDTQELFIGNGAVSEGAPAVGNSKVLTEHDNLFTLSDQYTYRNGSNVQTGASAATPIQRSLQSRLDDIVSARSFGANGDGTDQTVAIQRAIDQLFLPYANSMDSDNLKKRVTLKIHAGLYLLSDSIKLPPNVNLIGDGADKTVFRQTANFPVFETINGEGIAAQTTSLNQANLLNIQGITLESYLNNAGLKLASCKNSQFTDVKIKGPWTQGTAVNSTQIGILMEATSTPVTTKDNSFEKITIEGFSYGILSNHDVLHNVFNNTTIDTCGFGVHFGRDTVLGQVAQATGPINNTITNSRFININQNGIYVDGTFGRGGHSRKILERISLEGSLFSYDLDPEAKLEAENINHSNFHFVHDNYRNIHLNFSDNSIDGVLLDCGVSSPQLDNPERGFSFKDNGPLDMRFNPKAGVSCAEIVNTFDEKDISKILWDYGEEKESRRIAKAIVERRSVKGFTETKDLSELICSVKKRKTKKHPATKSFQA